MMAISRSALKWQQVDVSGARTGRIIEDEEAIE